MSDLRDAVIQLSLAIEKLAPLSAGERQLEIERHARHARDIALTVNGVAGKSRRSIGGTVSDVVSQPRSGKRREAAEKNRHTRKLRADMGLAPCPVCGAIGPLQKDVDHTGAFRATQEQETNQ